jgi:lipoate-protein ligase A
MRPSPTQGARWIDVGRVAPLDFHATYTGLAYAQTRGAAPIVVCGRPGPHVSLGQSQTLAEVEASVDVPVIRRALGGGAVWVDENQLSYAIVAPLALAPPRHDDWHRWALAPAVATFASFGLAVEQVDEDLWLRGKKIAGSGAATLGVSAVVASSFLMRFPRQAFADAMAAPSTAYRERVRHGLSAAMTDWESEAPPPTFAVLSTAFAREVEREFGWNVEASLPTREETAAIADWRAELAEPIERGDLRRVRDGIKLNARLSVVADGDGARLVCGGGAKVSSKGRK